MEKKFTIDTFLNENDKKAVEEAVHEAEAKTSGEIKVLVVQRSGKAGLSFRAKKRNVEERAIEEFFKMGIDKTRDQTGVLIMISLDERMVDVKADEAIDKKVTPGTWDETVNMIVNAVKQGKPADGICNAVMQVGTLLAENFPIKKDDKNELSDDVEFKR